MESAWEGVCFGSSSLRATIVAMSKLMFARKHKKILFPFVILVIVIGGYIAYDKISLIRNRQAFERARVAIDTIYADIVAQTGQPDNSKRVSNCARSNVALGEGSMSCDVAIDFIYGLADEAAANIILEEIQSVVKNHENLFKPIKPLSTSIRDSLVANTLYHTAADNYKSGALDCKINYVYDTPREISLKLKNQSLKPLEINVGCYGFARSAYYPLLNQGV